MGNNPDDDENRLFKKIQMEMKRNGDTKFVWIDYSCVLYAIPDIMSQLEIIRLHANKQLQDSYDCSVWCQLEAIFLDYTVGLKSIANRKMNIYDWNDFYAVLSSFIKLYCDERKVFNFFTDSNLILK